jgi:hypothetical protein
MPDAMPTYDFVSDTEDDYTNVDDCLVSSIPYEREPEPPRKATFRDYCWWYWDKAQQARRLSPWQIEVSVTPLTWMLIPHYEESDYYEPASVSWLCLRVSWWVNGR